MVSTAAIKWNLWWGLQFVSLGIGGTAGRTGESVIVFFLQYLQVEIIFQIV